ncbi:MAG TPA: hypothetical protein VMU62_09025, partial [Acidobacteriaceae bacterium]|nr:hypothetical protein [Acidobacteriaceae bacterium]
MKSEIASRKFLRHLQRKRASGEKIAERVDRMGDLVLQSDTKRSLYIAWGLAIIMVGVGFVVGGPYWGVALISVGLVLV